MAVNPYQKYKEETVRTMTGGELLILLYDELLKRLTAAELLVGQEKYESFEEQLEGAEKIVRHLVGTLDFQYDISKELYRIYDFLLVELSRMKVSRRTENLDRLKSMIKDLRVAFKSAQKKVEG